MAIENSGIDRVSVSIVSHHHGDMLEPLLADLQKFPEVYQIIITINLPEKLPFIPCEIIDNVMFIHNNKPRGFAANHNAAFLVSSSPYFCVLNPDVRLPDNPFPKLLEALKNESVGVAAPAVFSQDGKKEDSSRFFPTPKRLIKKIIHGDKGIYPNSTANECYAPDWVAGMFMLFTKKTFYSLGGFDEKYYLYYEDVDICARIWSMKKKVMLFDSVSIVHQAQRSSHKNLKFAFWHLRSMLRFFSKYLISLPR